MVNDGIKVEYYQTALKGKADSFWFDGEIAKLSTWEREVMIVASGEIRIHNKDGEIVFDGKTRNCGFPEFGGSIRNDDDLSKLIDLGYVWVFNNWFEPLFRYANVKDSKWEDLLGTIADTYDEAIALGYDIIKDDIFWNKADSR